jgi:hypothetical protein
MPLYVPSYLKPLNNQPFPVAYYQDIQGILDQDFYIDGINGNDNNTGLVGFPLKTGARLQTLLGPNPLFTQSVTIHILNTPSDNCVNLDFTRDGYNVCLSIIGTTTILHTDTVSYYIPALTWYNEGILLTATGITDWRPYVGKRLNFGNSWSRVCKSNPDGYGDGYCRITEPMFHDGNPQHAPTTWSTTVPTVGQSFTVESVVDVKNISINAKGPSGGVTPENYVVGSEYIFPVYKPYVMCETIAASVSANINISSPYQFAGLVCYDCDFQDFCTNSVTSTIVSGGGNSGGGCFYAGGSLKYYGISHISNCQYEACVFFLPTQRAITELGLTTPNCAFTDVVFQGVALRVYASSCYLNNVGIFDVIFDGNINEALYIYNDGMVRTSGFLIGNGNTIGIAVQVAINSRMIYDGPTTTSVLHGASRLGIKPTIKGGGASDIGYPNIQGSWSQVPSRHGSGTGTATLIGGSVTISNLLMQSDAVVRAWYVSENNPFGVLKITGQTATGFTIQSSCSSDTNSVAYEWTSALGGNGGIFVR